MREIESYIINGDAKEIINDGVDNARSMANDAVSVARDALSRLGESDGTSSLVLTEEQQQSVLAYISDALASAGGVSIESPSTPPAADAMTPAFALAPERPTIGAVDPFVVPDVPAFDVDAPTLLDITMPVIESFQIPEAPTMLEVGQPVAPDFVLPDVPQLYGLDLPSAPTLHIDAYTASFDGVRPDVPDLSNTWSEIEYSTALLGTLNGRLLDMVGGMSTGLSPQVENAIFERARAREIKVLRAKSDAALKTLASRGFRLPAGVAQRAIAEILAEQVDKELSFSRDVMVKQAELEQENLKFSIQYAVSLEGQLLQHFNNVQARGFEAFKLTVTTRIELFNARVGLFNADVQAFAARTEAFKAALQGELAKLEIFKAQVEAQKAVGALNESQVKIYTSQVAAVGELAQIYKAKVEAAGLLVQNENAKIEGYKAVVSAAEARVRAKTAEIQGYSERIKAEVAKTEMYGQQVGAYKSRVDAYGSLVNAKIASQAQQFKQVAEFPLEVYRSQVNAYQSEIQAEASRLGALAQVYDAKVRGYSAHEQAKVGVAQVSVQELTAYVNAASAQANVASELAKTRLLAAQQEYETTQTSIRATAQIYGQLAAAALSVMNINASASLSESTSLSSSRSQSESLSESNSSSTSMSTSVSYNHNSSS